MQFKTFILEQEYDASISQSARYLVDNNIDPSAIDELTYILQEGLLGTAGAALGTALGGPLGTAAGALIGQKAGQGVSNWFKSANAMQIGPVFQQAKTAIDNLVKTLTAINQQAQPQPQQTPQQAQQPQPQQPQESVIYEDVNQLQNMLQQAQQLQTSLSQIEPAVQQTDQELSTQHTQQAQQAGGIAQKLQGMGQKQGMFGKVAGWLGNQAGKVGALNQQGGVRRGINKITGKLGNWAKKHPTIAAAGQTAANMAVGYGLGRAMQGGEHGQAPQGHTQGQDQYAHPGIQQGGVSDAQSSITLDNGNQLPIPQGVTDIPSYLQQVSQAGVEMGNAPLPMAKALQYLQGGNK